MRGGEGEREDNRLGWFGGVLNFQLIEVKMKIQHVLKEGFIVMEL